METTVHRTQIYLTKEQYQYLRQQAEKRRASIAEIVRELINEQLPKEKRLRLHTTNFILDEVYTYFCRAHEIAVEMAELIIDNPLISLHRVGVDDEENAFKILTDFADKDFSYTDATSFSFMERLAINHRFS
jgi:predicted nucleic acid-binding protein